MKKLIFLLFFFGVVDGFGQRIRSVTMDEVVKIIDSSNSPLIINFWATWCKPCIEEIPYFEKQAAQYKDVQLILVSLDFKDDYPKKLEKFAAKNKYRSEILWLSETDADSFCPKIDKQWVGALPATLFVNRTKNYRNFIGISIKEDKLIEEINKLIN